MEGGIWELTTWDKLDPAFKVPKPDVGEKFLFASRYSIYSGKDFYSLYLVLYLSIYLSYQSIYLSIYPPGVISLESPIMEVSKGTSQRLMFQYYLRGSVTYPVVLRWVAQASTVS